MTTSLTDIATTIRKHSPGVLPESLLVFPDLDRLYAPNAFVGSAALPDPIAEAVLRDAMVRDALLSRDELIDGTGLWYPDLGGEKQFADSAHGGSLGACYAAWCFAKGIA